MIFTMNKVVGFDNDAQRLATEEMLINMDMVQTIECVPVCHDKKTIYGCAITLIGGKTIEVEETYAQLSEALRPYRIQIDTMGRVVLC